jgi:hypothetical protein
MKSSISLHYKLIVENPSSFCQPLFRRHQLSNNSVRVLDGTRILTFNSRNPSSLCQTLFRRHQLTYNSVRALDGTIIHTFNSRNPSRFCQQLFRRQLLSYNSRQNTRRDNNLLLKKIDEMIP